jgi:putative ABC transport system ATP-binding protein
MKIKTEALTRIYHMGSTEIVAVDKVDLEIDEEEFIAMLGPSGSGKSTLLNLIGLNDYPTSGKIFLDNVDTSRLSGRDRRKIRLSRIGFVFQTFNLLSTLNAVENVELPLALSGKSQEEQRKTAIRLLNTVGLSSRLYHRPRELSIGEMQRVALARAVVNDPEVIIADEPTGELDSKTAKEIISLLKEINRKHKTAVIVATHDEKITKVADNVYTIQDGTLKLQR